MRKVLQTALSAGLITLAGAAFAQSGGSGGTGTSPSEGSGATQERSPSSESGTSGSSGGAMQGSGASGAGSASTTGAPPQDVVGKNVLGPQGEEIGEIESIEGNQVIVSVGGFLGMGERKVALPWDQLSMSGAGEDAKITTTMTKDQLKSLPEHQEGGGGTGGTGGTGGSTGGTR